MPTNRAVHDVLVPAAGLGTRMLPATRAVPKELLPLVDRPIIQYGVEEAARAGIRRVVLVTSPGNTLSAAHFAPAPELEAELAARGKPELLAVVRELAALADVTTVHQPAPRGLGHAVLCGRDAVGDAPFAVMLPDDVIDADPPALCQMLDVFAATGDPVLLVERVPHSAVSRYGIIAAEPVRDGVFRVTDPRREAGPRRRAVRSRHHRALPAHPRRLPGAGGDRSGRRRGDPVDRRAAPAARPPADLRLPAGRDAARRRQPARVSQGDHPLRPAAAGPRARSARLSRERGTQRVGAGRRTARRPVQDAAEDADDDDDPVFDPVAPFASPDGGVDEDDFESAAESESWDFAASLPSVAACPSAGFFFA